MRSKQFQFDSVATEVIQTANDNVQRVFESLEVLALTSTSFIKQEAANNEDDAVVVYPEGFFTLPDAEVHLRNARQMSSATIVGYAPIVQTALEYDLWSNYSQDHVFGWIQESYEVDADWNATTLADDTTSSIMSADDFFQPKIWYLRKFDVNGNVLTIDEQTALTCPARADAGASVNIAARERVQENPDDGPFAPIWVASPAPRPNKPSNINYNLMADPIFRLAAEETAESGRTSFHDICQAASTWFDPLESQSGNDLYSLVVTPTWNVHGDDAIVVGYFYAAVAWANYFANVLDSRNNVPVLIVLKSQCGAKAFTYRLEGAKATLVSKAEDTHLQLTRYEDMAHTETFAPFAYSMSSDNATNVIHDEITGEVLCRSNAFTITVYPTEQFEMNYTTDQPLYYTLIVLSIFLFTVLAFFFFDCLVQRRQSTIMNTALRQNALVSSLFPKNIQKQLMEDLDAENVKNKTGKAGLRSYLNNEAAEIEEHNLEDGTKSKPIADLFPETTIMFADISGFTAWSSTREPSAVFTLLEAIYAEFDSSAKRRRVFKVEVVGDCYVAVAGLPDPRPDHAIVMAKFANDCLNRMFRMVRKLEVELGPDTAELGLRVGLHSGPVVAGVLRGDKSRFQLFGDTVSVGWK